MKNKLFVIFFSLGLFCGKVQALPQDWPCDVFELSPVEKIKASVYKFEGKIGDYQVVVDEFGLDEPSAYCGNDGCFETIKNLRTGEEEHLFFKCDTDTENLRLQCWIIDDYEILLHKVSKDEYRVEWCGAKYYEYIKYSECTGCTCILKNSNPKISSDSQRNCLREDNNLRCFRPDGYDKWRNYKSDLRDFENCVDLGI